ncbi:MAG: hypothetical protein QM778_26985 [Myxococcales bacterium]
MLNEPSQEAPKPVPRDRAFTGFFTLVACAVACAITALAIPRAIEPNVLPPLVLDDKLVEAVLEADRALAQRTPQFQRADELEQLYVAHGLSELDPNARYDAGRQRRLSIYADGLSPTDRNLLRVRATERAMAALRTGGGGPEGAGQLGVFPRSLVEHRLVTAEGLFRAPWLSIRAAYKARWNLIHARAPHEGLAAVELQAFEGFKALHAELFPPQERALSAQRFHEAGGKRSAEAYGVFLYQGGALNDGTALLETAYAQRGELRLRNMLLTMWMEEAAER